MAEKVPTAEAARILGVAARTVYYYARDYSDFPEPGKFGSSLVWDVQELKDWRARHPLKNRADSQPAPKRTGRTAATRRGGYRQG